MNIIIENDSFRLEISPNCRVTSLICKETGEECLVKADIPMFSLTEERPYNNEIKLAYPNKRTTFGANRVRLEDGKLIVGFELVTFEAQVGFEVKNNYVVFTLEDFIVKPEDFEGLSMSPPPVCEFRIVQLPVKRRKNFGAWLNVMHDHKAAVCVMANSPYARIDSEKREAYDILTADCVRGIKLKGCSAALICEKPESFLDVVEKIEEDFDLPRGVKSRKSDLINASVYWMGKARPDNIDEHIKYAKEAGFRLMLLYYECFFDDEGYHWCGDYDWREEYPEREADLKKMLDKIKAAGITPGLHVLHSHIGINSRYISPVCDHRLNLTRHFTLAKPLGLSDTTIYVEENPEGAVMHEACRVLNFGGELIHYENYTAEYPYCFTGCKRGYYNTNKKCHEMGTIGGILDISEFGAHSVYINQNTSLQDEVAQKLAAAYNVGFEFVYFDGSEGTNAPFEFHIPNAQYKVYKKLDNAPIFCEGAAKAHFGWHMLSGGNAFDLFPMRVFKEKIAEFPLKEAAEMKKDFTRVNFGWWKYDNETMPDIYEYGTSKAAAFDCPATVQIWETEIFRTNPRTADNFEVIRRWEDVRAKKWLTPEQKEALKNPEKEFILLVNEAGEYELSEYRKITLQKEADEDISAFLIDRKTGPCVVLWHKTGEGKLMVPVKGNVCYKNDLCENAIGVEKDGENVILPVSGRRYFTSDMSRDELIRAFENARLS